MTGPRELTQLRLAAQLLAGPGLGSAAEVVSWMTAIQAQDFPGAKLSVALRSRGLTTEAVTQALDSGQVVRSWPMRGTLFFTAAEDLNWLLGLTAARTQQRFSQVRAGLDLDAGTLVRGEEVARQLLREAALSRSQLIEQWQGRGIVDSSRAGTHLIRYLAQSGVLCLGPLSTTAGSRSRPASTAVAVSGSRQGLVLVEEWIPAPRQLPEEAALTELARRYFRSHGPATERDLAWWSGLTLGQVRAGIAAARPELESLRVGDVEYLIDPATPQHLAEHRTQAREVRLLPGFDEYLLGYRRRDDALPPEHAEAIVPGGNGMFLATVIDGGRVVGTWKRAGSAKNPRIDATPLSVRFSQRVSAALPGRFDAVTALQSPTSARLT